MGIQQAAERTGKEHSSRGVKFDIAKMPYAEPGSDAEGQKNGNRKAIGCHGKGEYGGKSARSVEEQGHAPRGEAAREQAMMDVVTVCAKNGLTAKKAAGDGKRSVKQGNRKRHERRGHAE